MSTEKNKSNLTLKYGYSSDDETEAGHTNPSISFSDESSGEGEEIKKEKQALNVQRQQVKSTQYLSSSHQSFLLSCKNRPQTLSKEFAEDKEQDIPLDNNGSNDAPKKTFEAYMAQVDSIQALRQQVIVDVDRFLENIRLQMMASHRWGSWLFVQKQTDTAISVLRMIDRIKQEPVDSVTKLQDIKNIEKIINKSSSNNSWSSFFFRKENSTRCYSAAASYSRKAIKTLANFQASTSIRAF